ncbi:hypothetical protein L1987_44228 [Smallanthus sonchifolius]|uniref:Uncharacterized protein n=1 Tax=Smallanthus sonchifolius TaxID=185202 RepID=A0ACB9GPW5_9ASTR|nr:hypothetical protein L1987_44228 [Smallanthus sonchifolius]
MDSDRLLPYTFSLYSDDEVYYDDVYASDDDDRDLEDNRVNSTSEKSYHLLNEDDLVQRQQKDITNVTTVLSIPRDSACMLLLRYNWYVSRLHEAWFQDEAKVRGSVGLLEVDPAVKFPRTDGKIVDCGICFDSVRKCDTATCGCDHSFCKMCWKGYVSTAVNDGPGCLTLRCPEPSCDAAVCPDMINELATVTEKKRYDHFWLMTYVESSNKIKWCPGPGCDYAVEFADDFEIGSYDVSCFCKYGFCWKCMEDAHRPLNCETGGGDDGRACNAYTKEGGGVPAEQQRELAKKAIERYTHYYERWAANEKSRKQALSDLHKIESDDLMTLSLNYSLPETQLQFIIDAWLQIVECMCVLKWTYAYGYYIPETEEAKRIFFEYVQGEAESGLERLHLCAEKELQTYIMNEDDDASEEQFNCFRVKLSDLTRVTRSYFENLVRALENGLSDVDSHEAQTKGDTGFDQGAAGGSSSNVRGRSRAGQASDGSKRMRMTTMRRPMNDTQRHAAWMAGESWSNDQLGDQDR